MRSRNLIAALVLLLVVTSAAGCGQASTEPEPTTELIPTVTAPPAPPQKAQPSQDTSPLPQPGGGEPAGSTSPLPTPVPTADLPERGAVPIPPEAVEAVKSARADLSERLGAQIEVEVVSVEAVEWQDASLGCPQPGQMYAQVITSGFHVILRAGEEDYTYHTDRGRVAVLCDKESAAPGEKEMVVPTEPTIPSTQNPPPAGSIALAKEDLAKRLGISTNQIALIEVKEVTWPDASLGCPHPDMRYKQVPVDGSLIRLGVEGRVYEYHSGGGRAPFLCEQTQNAKGTPNPPALISPPGSESN